MRRYQRLNGTISLTLALVCACLVSVGVANQQIRYWQNGCVSSEQLASVYGAGCIWEQSLNCPAGRSCADSGCNYLTLICPDKGNEVPDTGPPVFPPIFSSSYITCVNTAAGLTECGVATDVPCGKLDKCAADCHPGTPIFALEPIQSVCKSASQTNNIKEETRASGDYCYESSF